MNQTAPRDYSLIAPFYDNVFNKLLGEGHQKIGGLLKKSRSPKGTTKILEVGVGSGLTFAHVPTGVEFVGIDVNEKMLELAKHKVKRLRSKKITLKLMNAQKLEFKSNSYDLVIAPSVLSAMDDPMKGLKEMIRVTKKGGKIAIITNLRHKGSVKSEILRLLDPLTRRFVGFRMDLRMEDFMELKHLRLIEESPINNFMGLPLSTYLLFEKI